MGRLGVESQLWVLCLLSDTCSKPSRFLTPLKFLQKGERKKKHEDYLLTIIGYFACRIFFNVWTQGRQGLYLFGFIQCLAHYGCLKRSKIIMRNLKLDVITQIKEITRASRVVTKQSKEGKCHWKRNCEYHGEGFWWEREPALFNIENNNHYSPTEQCRHTLGYAFHPDITVFKTNQLPSRSQITSLNPRPWLITSKK